MTFKKPRHYKKVNLRPNASPQSLKTINPKTNRSKIPYPKSVKVTDYISSKATETESQNPFVLNQIRYREQQTELSCCNPAYKSLIDQMVKLVSLRVNTDPKNLGQWKNAFEKLLVLLEFLGFKAQLGTKLVNNLLMVYAVKFVNQANINPKNFKNGLKNQMELLNKVLNVVNLFKNKDLTGHKKLHINLIKFFFFKLKNHYKSIQTQTISTRLINNRDPKNQRRKYYTLGMKFSGEILGEIGRFISKVKRNEKQKLPISVVPTRPISLVPKRPKPKKLNKDTFNFIKKNSTFFGHFNKIVGSPNHWHTQWGNLHLHSQSVIIRQLIQKYYFKFGLYVNNLHIILNTGIICVLACGFSVFKKPKAKRNNAQYKKNLKSPKLIANLASFLIEINKVQFVNLNFYQLCLPRKYRIEAGVSSFKKIKRLYYFRECLQLMYAIFKGYGSANLLGSLIYTYTRKNPRRVAFLGNIQRLIAWHYRTVTNLKIQGIRVEVKGRFNAKSRAIKRILSIGCVKIHVKSSNVDFAQITAITKFGSLGIKVWICPKKLTKANFRKVLAKSGQFKIISNNHNENIPFTTVPRKDQNNKIK